MKIRLCISVVLFLGASEAAALSCMPDVNPYEAVESAYNNSDLVFIGRVQESQPFAGHVPDILVEAIWKGPEVLSIKMRRSSWGPSDSRVFFAVQSDDPFGWSDRYPLCFPHQSGLTVEQVLLEILGDPIPPSEEAVSHSYIVFLVILLAAAAGMGVFAWNSRLEISG